MLGLPLTFQTTPSTSNTGSAARDHGHKRYMVDFRDGHPSPYYCAILCIINNSYDSDWPAHSIMLCLYDLASCLPSCTTATFHSSLSLSAVWLISVIVSADRIERITRLIFTRTVNVGRLLNSGQKDVEWMLNRTTWRGRQAKTQSTMARNIRATTHWPLSVPSTFTVTKAFPTISSHSTNRHNRLWTVQSITQSFLCYCSQSWIEIILKMLSSYNIRKFKHVKILR